MFRGYVNMGSLVIAVAYSQHHYYYGFLVSSLALLLCSGEFFVCGFPEGFGRLRYQLVIFERLQMASRGLGLR